MTLTTRYPAATSAAREESLARAILQLNPRSARAKRVVALVTIGIPAIGFGIALYLMFTGRATLLDYTLFVAFYAIQMFGITIGFHRYLAHKAFKTSRFFEGVLMITGSMALEGPLLFWVTTHRRHHRYSDEAGDPHSPNLSGTGMLGKLKGLWVRPHPLDVQRSRVEGDGVRARCAARSASSQLQPNLSGLGAGEPAAAGNTWIHDRRQPRSCVLRLHLWRPGTGVPRQPGGLVRRFHQSHGRFASVRQQG